MAEHKNAQPGKGKEKLTEHLKTKLDTPGGDEERKTERRNTRMHSGEGKGNGRRNIRIRW